MDGYGTDYEVYQSNQELTEEERETLEEYQAKIKADSGKSPFIADLRLHIRNHELMVRNGMTSADSIFQNPANPFRPAAKTRILSRD